MMVDQSHTLLGAVAAKEWDVQNIEDGQIQVHEIVSRQRRGPLWLADPSDFILSRGTICPPSTLATALPYVINFETQQVYATVHNDLGTILREPFLYKAQHEHALQVASIPLRSLPYPATRDPILLIHSIGRCGSTLMSRLLSALGAVCFSEPDVFSQLSGRKQHRDLPHADLVRLSTGLLRLFLIRQWPGPVAFKFRSFCSNIAVELHEAWPSSQSIFMIRNRHDWAYSMYQVFSRSPDFCARKLRAALIDLRKLKQAAPDLIILNYDELLADRYHQMGRICDLINAPLDGKKIAVDRAFDEDSQSGTRLARERRGTTSTGRAEIASEFDKHWARMRPSAVIEELGLDDLY